MCKSDRSHALFLQGIKVRLSILIHAPDFQPVKNFIIFINESVSIGIIPCKVCETITGLCAEKLGSIVDDTVTVLIKRKKSASGNQFTDFILYAITVNIEEKGLVRHLCHISLKINHKRITKCKLFKVNLFLVVFHEAAAHIQVEMEVNLSSVLGLYRAFGCKGCTFGLFIIVPVREAYAVHCDKLRLQCGYSRLLRISRLFSRLEAVCLVLIREENLHQIPQTGFPELPHLFTDIIHIGDRLTVQPRIRHTSLNIRKRFVPDTFLVLTLLCIFTIGLQKTAKQSSGSIHNALLTTKSC